MRDATIPVLLSNSSHRIYRIEFSLPSFSYRIWSVKKRLTTMTISPVMTGSPCARLFATLTPDPNATLFRRPSVLLMTLNFKGSFKGNFTEKYCSE